MSGRSTSAAGRFSPDWVEQLRHCVRQQPLLDTNTSLSGLAGDVAAMPRTVFMGVGLCARGEMTRAVPLDLLGMVLPAEALRRSLGCAELLVLIADTHALENGFSPEQVEERAAALEQVLRNIRRACRLTELRVIRASTLHSSRGYQRMLLKTRSRATAGTHEYLLQQFADVLYLNETQGPLLKVGWALPSSDSGRRRDEVTLDRTMSTLTDSQLPFVYCKPGRTLADASPRMPPYVVKRPDSRFCLDRRENPEAKLRAAVECARPSTISAFRRHIRRLVYTWGSVVEPLPRGPLELRVSALMERVRLSGAAAVTEAR